MAPTYTTDERESQRKLMAQKRAASRDIEIPKCSNPARRKAAESDIFHWFETYCSHRFFNELTDSQREIINEVLHRIETGGDKAIAAPRGDGKTTIVKCIILYCLLTGRLTFAVIIAANGTEAKGILDDIKNELESNELLTADYPEVCAPIQALERWAARARLQTAAGKPTNIRWADDTIVLPTVEGSVASGSCLKTRGMDAAIRGLNYLGRRPEFVLIDDPETDESANSDTEIAKREKKIERDIAGLAGQSRRMGRLILCTIQNRKSLAAKFTDLKQKSSWGGRRYRQLVKKPDNEELWEQYIAKLRAGQEDESDPDGHGATAFYEANREEMDKGAILNNPARYDPERGEIIALQAFYNYVARNGWDAAATELQNDPPEDDGPQDSGINATLVASRLSGRPRWEIPANTLALTIGLDLSDRSSHWVATAWQENCVGMVVAYGIMEVTGISKTSDRKAKAAAEFDALHNWRTMLQEGVFHYDSGEIRDVDMVLIDSGDGDHAAAVYKFCREVGMPYLPSKGASPFHPGTNSTTRKVGNRWYRSKLAEGHGRGMWLSMLDADHWKRFVHERFLTETRDAEQFFRPGSLSLFSPATWNEHHTYAHHIVAEVWQTSFKEGKGEKAGWYVKSKNNHYLDATAMACAAADMCGVRLLGQKPVAPAPLPMVEPSPGFIRQPSGTSFIRGS